MQAKNQPEENLSQWNPAELTVVVAETDPELRQDLFRLVAAIGFRKVVAASDGISAWTHLRNLNADMVISAWDMPEMSGISLLKVMRADSRHFHTPVILISDQASVSQVLEAGQAGVTDIILRPLDAKTFKEKLSIIFAGPDEAEFIQTKKLFLKGVDLMKNGLWERAIVFFQKILEAHEDAEVYYNLGYINTAQGRYKPAIKYFRKATQIKGDFARAFEKMGECFAKLGQPEQAEEHMGKAAAIYMEREMDDSAELIFNKVLKLNPDTINVYNSLGIIYRRQGRFQDAVKQYQKALKVNPQNENIYYNLGRIYYDTQLYTEAREMINKALEIDPEFEEARDMIHTLDQHSDEAADADDS